MKILSDLGLTLPKLLNRKLVAALDECLLDEDIGGFVGAYLFDNVEAVKESAATMKNIPDFCNGFLSPLFDIIFISST